MLGPTVAPPKERVAGLTERELEVLRLVAQGRSNREIAQALLLSEYTVARHLTHIFTKTGVENRAGAAAFALRHNVV
jgi:DNA-binding NarL/FixJ family response regulator